MSPEEEQDMDMLILESSRPTQLPNSGQSSSSTRSSTLTKAEPRSLIQFTIRPSSNTPKPLSKTTPPRQATSTDGRYSQMYSPEASQSISRRAADKNRSERPGDEYSPRSHHEYNISRTGSSHSRDANNTHKRSQPTGSPHGPYSHERRPYSNSTRISCAASNEPKMRGADRRINVSSTIFPNPLRPSGNEGYSEHGCPLPTAYSSDLNVSPPKRLRISEPGGPKNTPQPNNTVILKASPPSCHFGSLPPQKTVRSKSIFGIELKPFSLTENLLEAEGEPNRAGADNDKVKHITRQSLPTKLATKDQWDIKLFLSRTRIIEPSSGLLIALKQLKLQWDAFSDQAAKIYEGSDLVLSIPFNQIEIVQYEPRTRHMSFKFPDQNKNAIEIIMVLLCTDSEWQQLRSKLNRLASDREYNMKLEVEVLEYFEDRVKTLKQVHDPFYRNRVMMQPSRSPWQPPPRRGDLRNKGGLPKVLRSPVQARPKQSPSLAGSSKIPSSRTSKPNIQRSPTRSHAPPKICSKSPDVIDSNPGQGLIPPKLLSNRNTRSDIPPETLDSRSAEEFDDSLFLESETGALNTGGSEVDLNTRQAFTLTSQEPADPVKTPQKSHSSSLKGSIDVVPVDKTRPPVFEEQRIAPSSLRKVAVPPKYQVGVARPKIPENPEGVFYKRLVRESRPIPVAVGDLVVRLRSEKDLDRGKADENDIFDGPWQIQSFHEDIRYAASVPNHVHAPEHIRAEEQLMHTTKVKLSFPNGYKKSYAPAWVEIKSLLPLFYSSRAGATVYANNLTVRELDKFKSVGNDSKEQSLSDEEDLYFAEIAKDVFVAVIEIQPQCIAQEDEYELSKLRNKRLRIYDESSKHVRRKGLETEKDDPLVKCLLKKRPDLCKGKVVVAEYLVHWAGWANEDDTWESGFSLPAEFVKEYHLISDTWRGRDEEGKPVEEMVYKEDLPVQKESARPRKSY